MVINPSRMYHGARGKEKFLSNRETIKFRYYYPRCSGFEDNKKRDDGIKKRKRKKQTSINNERTEKRKIGQFLLLNNGKERKSKLKAQ